jgi:hypothetical protein
LVVTLILPSWLTAAMTPTTLGPPCWILMGATAISVSADGRYRALPADIPVVRATASFVGGFRRTVEFGDPPPPGRQPVRPGPRLELVGRRPR